MEWMILPLKRYAQFQGRSRRKEYWMWILFQIGVGIVLGILDTILGLGGTATGGASSAPGSFGAGGNLSGGILSNIFSLATLLPNITVAVRRLHDTNRSGWWIFLPLAPLVFLLVPLFLGLDMGGAKTGMGVMAFIGIALLAVLICGIVTLVWYCTAGTHGPNRFGDDPKADIPADLAKTFE